MSVSFDRVFNIYDATRGLPPEVSAQVTECILNLVSATPETRFFEPGIGTGRIALPLIERGYSYTGIDISEKMLEELCHKLNGQSNQLQLVQGDATALPFEDHSFDAALTVHLLHLVSEWRTVLSEIRRVLKPEGIFLYTHGRQRDAVSGDVEFNPVQAEFSQQWKDILATYEFQLHDYGATEADVLEALNQQGARLETIIAAQWRIRQTVGEVFDCYRGRTYSSSWQIPDKIFLLAINDLTEWCQQHYPSLDLDASHEARFRITVVRNWA